MSRAKVFISILMVLILIALSGASVWAAPNLEESISGEIQEITIEDETVLVTLLVDETADETQAVTIRMSLETAEDLNLVDKDGNLTVNRGDDVTIPLSDEIEVIEEGEEAQHPVASALASAFANLFSDATGLDYETIMEYHEEGNGFGVIAQACWMSLALEGDASLVSTILEAKKTGDFSAITLPDGTTPKNWGQFKKAVSGDEKAKENLGAIMSGRAKGEQEQEQEQEQEATATSNQGKDKKGKGPGEDGPPGKSKDKGSEGGGPPAEPPGQGKDKGGDKGGGGGGKGKGK